MEETVVNIPRPIYLDRIMPYIGKNLIKVLTGQRRVGKSFILNSVRNKIRRINPDANILHIDMEDFAFSHITNAAGLHDEITRRLKTETQNYIFIDEIQEVSGFEKVLRSLLLNPWNDIYVTGSNSTMLSSEIASLLAGRSIEFRIHPLSYVEFLEFHSMEDSDESLDTYLMYGGMPYLKNLPMRDTWHEYLVGLTDTLVYRDIVTRHSIRNNNFLKRLMMFMADNIGKIFTANNIAAYLKSQRVSGTVDSVQTYADYICQAYLINEVKRWDIKGKRLFEIGEKYYFEDLGVRNAIIGYRPDDIGGIIENTVYNHLVVKGYNVHVGVLPKGKEIDFIAEKNSERIYIQVALNVEDPATAAREFGNLEEITDNYEKILVTRRDSAPNSHNGIHMLSLREFLTS